MASAAPDQVTVVDGSYVRNREGVLLDRLGKITAHLRFGATTEITMASPVSKGELAAK